MRTRTTAVPTAAAAVLTVLLAGCGSSGGTTPTSGTAGGTAAGTSHSAPAATGDPTPCGVTDQATVASVFPGAGAGTAGEQRNCNYPITGGSGDVGSINVFYFGPSSDWDAEKSAAKDALGGLKDLSIGDGAYTGLTSTLSITVKAGGIIFGVQALPPTTGLPKADFYTSHQAVLEDLATKIAAQH